MGAPYGVLSGEWINIYNWSFAGLRYSMGLCSDLTNYLKFPTCIKFGTLPLKAAYSFEVMIYVYAHRLQGEL